MNTVSEKDIEKYLCEQVKKKLGGKAYKWVSPGNTGVPDRIVLVPWVPVIFVELKAPGKKPTKNQALRHNELIKLGFEVWIIDTKAGVDDLISAMADVQKYTQKGLYT